MLRRAFVDVVLGLVLAVVGQFVQLAGGALGSALGLPFPYETAPEDGSIPPALLHQIDLMFWLAALGMLLLTFGLGWLVKARGAAEGAARGAVWAGVVGLSQLLLGLGEGVVPVFGLAGVYGYLAAIVLGPTLAGLLRRRPS